MSDAHTAAPAASNDAPSANSALSPRLQALTGAGTLVLGGLLAWGATGIPSTAGYAGVGPNFLPWIVAVALIACGALLLLQALRGGLAVMPEGSGADRGDWPALAWVSAGVLLCAALITTIGFVLANALGFVLAVRGLRISEGRPGGDVRQALVDAATGLAIAAPVFWLFTKLLAINLPGLTGSGWL
jgi:putative tricarboxylic transport membrane protein